ncbi:MAG: DUF3604 domain-containing protein [Planctomycetaceae bacterium]|nr:DUF3604 domain-containing protein [Planctomycetaceae bacterium]
MMRPHGSRYPTLQELPSQEPTVILRRIFKVFPHHALMFVRTAIASAMFAIVSSASAAEAIELNPGTTTYDHHPSLCATEGGTTWIAWHSYNAGSDGVTVRRLDSSGQVGQLHSIGGDADAHGPPTIVACSEDRAWVVWSMKRGQRWEIVLRHWKSGEWSLRVPVSVSKRDAIDPAAIRFGDRLLLASCERIEGCFTVRGYGVYDGSWLPFSISNGIDNAYRPLLIQHHDEVWAFWDQYHNPNYSVCGRRLLPTLGNIEQVTPPSKYCLTPTALSHPTGLHIAWLQKKDVVGGPGVVSQWHTLHAAVRRDNRWQSIRDANGRTTAAELTQGLMAQITPTPIATGGYLGSRLRPMLHASGDQVWLLWERKSDHLGSTPNVAGDLVGRPINNGTWQSPLVLHRGYVDYHVVPTESSEQDSITVVASKLPRLAKRTYEQFDVKLAEAQPFEQDTWAGWNPVTLPIDSELTPRREVTIDGKTYKLFWADLHCHNNLSADAEGESDELNHYARDRAGLDVVVFTNNDFYNVPLTQYEYEIGNLFAKAHSVDGEFISLPGFEWTSRIPGVATAALNDPGNWLPPYRNRSYANHRSVIYPPTGGPLVHFTEVENDIAKLNKAVAAAGGVTLSQHPTFKLSGHAVEVGLELTSGWSNYIAQNPKLFHESLDQGVRTNGVRLGFVANGDSHRRAPGLSGALTGIYAETLTPAAIFDALRQRRCFATSGSQIFIDARADESFMGEEVTAKNRQITLNLHAIGTRDITSAVLIRDGEEIHRVGLRGTQDVRVEYTDEDLAPGTHWYYWRVSQDKTAPVLPGNLMVAHGHLAWSSPHWVVAE